MSAPYSDDLYSGDYSDDDQDALSPVDGYFHASSNSNLTSPQPSHPPPTSSNVPSVPNVLVEDPTLREQGAAKAREAEEERLNNASDPLESHAQPQSSSHTPSPSVAQSSSHYQGTYTTSPPTSPSHHHRRSVEEDDPIRFAGHTRPAASLPFARNADAPPAYSPSSPQSNHPSGSYQTFSPVQQSVPATAAAMGVPEEQQRLLSREPESMGGPPDGQKSPSLWQRTKDYWGHMPNMRKRLKSILGVLVILSIFLMVFSSFTLRPSHPHDDKDKDKDNDNNKGKGPGFVDKDPVKPPKDPKNNDGELVWRPLGSCLDQAHRMGTFKNSVEFRSDYNWSLVEVLEKNDKGHGAGWNPHVFGDLILRPTTGSSPAMLEVEVITNDANLRVHVGLNDEDQSYRVVTPRNIDWPHTDGAPCIQMRIIASIPRSSLVQKVSVESMHLDVLIEEGLSMAATHGTKLETVVGDIIAPTFDPKDRPVAPYTISSRDIVIGTVSGDIKGWYPLYDLLQMSSASGDIKIDIGPKAVDSSNPKSAVLDVSSASGQLELHEPIDSALKSIKPDRNFPPRDYVVKLGTSSGDITADLAVSSYAKVSSHSGDLKLRLWPVLDSGLLKTAGKKPSIETNTASGDTSLVLIDPLWTSTVAVGGGLPAPPAPPAPPSPPAPPAHRSPAWDRYDDWVPIGDKDPYLIIHPDKPASESEADDVPDVDLRIQGTPSLSVLSSKHNSISGQMKLVYPPTWEGSLYASTISGSQLIRGDDLQVDRTGGFMRTTRGHKGDGYSYISIDSVSGDQDVLIGKEPK